MMCPIKEYANTYALSAAVQGIAKTTPGFIAWRWAFFVPASCHVIMGIAVMLFAQVSRRGALRFLSGDEALM